MTRTHDLLITNQLLYRLSYISIFTFGVADLILTNQLLYRAELHQHIDLEKNRSGFCKSADSNVSSFSAEIIIPHFFATVNLFLRNLC